MGNNTCQGEDIHNDSIIHEIDQNKQFLVLPVLHFKHHYEQVEIITKKVIKNLNRDMSCCLDTKASQGQPKKGQAK